MKRIFLTPLLVLLSALIVNGQKNTEKEPTAKTKSNVSTIELSASDNLLTTLIKLDKVDNLKFDFEPMATDTPPNDSIETVVIKTIKSDSGDIVEVIIKDGKGNITRTLRIEEDLWDDFDMDSKDFSFKGKRFKVKPKKKHKNLETDWFSLDLGFNSLVHNGSASLPPRLSNLELDPLKSLHVNVLVFQQKLNIYKNYVGLVYGVNYDNNDYRFSNDIDFKGNNSGDSISYNKIQTEGFDRNKLTTRFLSVPLAVRFDFNPNKRRGGHITIGGHAGYRLTSFFKKVSFEGRDKIKTKVKDDYLLNNFRYGSFVRVGYGMFNVFGSYVFTPLFRENTAPEFNTVSFGISFGGF